MKLPEFADIAEAHQRIRSLVHRTPVLSSSTMNSILNCSLYFKCENLQKVGAFKFRGACNAVFALSEQQAARGVCTHSSGNHAAALALAARMRGIPAYIVMPETAPAIKKQAVESYGGQITFCKPTLEARETSLAKLAAQTGAVEIHPYNNFEVICGQGTAAKELIEDQGLFDIVMCPIGGGGLLSGTAIATRTLNPKALVIAAEPEGADDAYRSFHEHRLIPSVNPKTIADGLLTSVGEMNFRIIQRKTDEIVTVSERAIVRAMRMIWERMKIIIEPSAAVPLAAILENKLDVRGKKIGIILSGGNVDLEKLPFHEFM
ncbi:pyridoxal-phosphate dependent enzyme [Mangrovibacterium marinum]|uniref:Threonine dehydratase n=1 Tax=Mangrovibacterium marinum TaxID=1639118 RepID=A0A2T5C146_9BACT|nr:pyridoxal-phosphate dependent enzyme [Mangrovibacterium marinum]PTN08356.1 threonine dehydratase [Mangrovibacterium marinum]